MSTLLRTVFFILTLLYGIDILADEKDMHEQFAQGLALIYDKNYEQAVPIFSKLTKEYPALPEPYNNLAFIYVAQGNYIKAQDILQSAFKNNPSYALVYENLNMIYAKIARDIYEKTIGTEDTSREPLKNLNLIEHIFDRTENKIMPQNNPFEKDNTNNVPNNANAVSSPPSGKTPSADTPLLK